LRTTPGDAVDGRVHPGPSKALSRRLRGDLDNIVLKAMRKEPSERYASAAQLAEDLGRHPSGLPVNARPATLTYRAAKFARRHRSGVAAACLVSLAIGAGIAATLWQARAAGVERDRALAEKAKEQRLNAFLQNVLLSPDPSWNRGGAQGQREASLDDVLEGASSRASVELNDQPEAVASVERSIGVTYRGRGLYEEAERHLRASLETYRRVYGEGHTETVTTSYALAQCLFLKGDYASAEPLYRSAADFYRGRYEAGDAKMLTAMIGSRNDLAYLLRLRGYDAESEALLRDALRYAPLLSGDERALVAIPLGHLGLAREGRATSTGRSLSSGRRSESSGNCRAGREWSWVRS
jgi:tetratricopeptide (TPR) repeat protein